MKYSFRLLTLAASLIVTCSLLLIMYSLHNRAAKVGSKQQQALESMQSEYSDTDLLSLKGQVINASEAITLVRKHSSDLSFKINGASFSNVTALTKSHFEGSKHWRVEPVDSTGNGAIDTINFVSLNVGDNGVPSSLEDARNKLSIRLGVDDDWASIFNGIDTAREGIDYKVRISGLIGSSDDSSWNDLYTDLVEFVSTTGDGTKTVPYEMVRVPVGDEIDYSIIGPARGIATSESGDTAALVFSGLSCSIVGDDLGIQIDCANESILNQGTEDVIVYLYSE